jgi:hypothetical protein
MTKCLKLFPQVECKSRPVHSHFRTLILMVKAGKLSEILRKLLGTYKIPKLWLSIHKASILKEQQLRQLENHRLYKFKYSLRTTNNNN